MLWRMAAWRNIKTQLGWGLVVQGTRADERACLDGVCLWAVLVPAVLACSSAFHGHSKPGPKAWLLALALLQPAALLIDHGHFQYNGISLGLAVSSSPRLCLLPHLAFGFLASGWVQ